MKLRGWRLLKVALMEPFLGYIREIIFNHREKFLGATIVPFPSLFSGEFVWGYWEKR